MSRRSARPSSPGWLARLLVAAALGAACLLVLVVSLDLAGRPSGAGDNGDGGRLFCGAGLTPLSHDRLAEWKGGVVLEYASGPACPRPYPSSALLVMRAALAVRGDAGVETIGDVGRLYAVLSAAVTAAAAWAASRRRLWLAAVVVPPLLPLLNPDFSRFFVSTYSEPAGLLGTFAMLCGLGAVLATRRSDLWERGTALALVAAGGTLAATAKPAYLPVAAVAAVVSVLTALDVPRVVRPWTGRVVGPALAAVVVSATAVGAAAALDYQRDAFAAVNAHNLVYTTVLAERPGSTDELGLPRDAVEGAGQSFFWPGAREVPGADVVARDPDGVTAQARRLLLTDPVLLARIVGVGLQATSGRSLEYLPSEPYEWGQVRASDVAVGEQGADGPTLRRWLDAHPTPWWPSSLAAGCVLVALVAVALRRDRPWARAALVAGTCGALATGLVGLAVLGDGYFEIAKHVWLSAYLLDVGLAALGVTLVLALLQARRHLLERRAAAPPAGASSEQGHGAGHELAAAGPPSHGGDTGRSGASRPGTV